MYTVKNLEDLIAEIDPDNKLITYLRSTDFFIAPASIKYHYSYQGGLAEYTYNVCMNLLKLNEALEKDYSRHALITIGLLASFSRINLYELYYKNEKTEHGWKSVASFKITDRADREQYGDMGFTSLMIGKQYIDLVTEQEVALCNYQHVNNPAYPEINSIVARYPLTLMLFMAIQSTMYISYQQSLTIDQ